LGAFISLLRVRKDNNPKFVYFLLSSSEIQAKFHALASTTTNISNLSTSKLVSVPISLPPLPEQERIVARIESLFTQLDAGVAALKRLQTALKRYRASLLKAACEGHLVPQDPNDEPAEELLQRLGKSTLGGEELTSLPDGWNWATVETIGVSTEQIVLTGPFGLNLGREDFISSGVPVLTIGCLTEQGLELEKAKYISEEKAVELNRYRVRENDLLFSRMATVGRAGLVTKKFEGLIFNYHLMRLRLASEIILPDFFLVYVRGASIVTDYVKNVNHGATRDGINTEQLLAMPVAFPPIAEQMRIVAEVERRLSVVQEFEQAISANLKRAARLRQAILQRAFEGKLVEQ
jgi:type I restriction enzyme, S subunit